MPGLSKDQYGAIRLTPGFAIRAEDEDRYNTEHRIAYEMQKRISTMITDNAEYKRVQKAGHELGGDEVVFSMDYMLVPTDTYKKILEVAKKAE